MDELTHEAYLEKKVKTRKIVYGAILALCLALAIVVISLASINVDIRPKFVTGPSQVIVYSDSTQKTFYNGEEEFQKFDKLYKNMFNVSTLSAIFSGQLGGYSIDETIDSFETTSGAISSTVKDALGENYVKLFFDSEMTLKAPNGKDYKSVYNDKTLSYQEVYFSINEENAVNSFTFFFKVTGNNLKKTTISKITLRANTSKLFKEFIG